MTQQPLQEEQRHCDTCAWAGTCVCLADLRSLVLNHDGLEADYGWDIFSFTAEAKQQYRTAKANECCVLSKVREEASVLAPDVDFTIVK